MSSNFLSSKPHWVWLILFVEGLVSVSLQVIFIRQLTPFVGNDVNVVGIVIGVYLTALSIGYVKGGGHGGDVVRLSNNFLYSALWSGFFMSYYVMSLWFEQINQEAFLDVNYLSMTIYLLVGLFPVVFWLGQTVPLMVGILKDGSASSLSGKSLGINTVGSVVGAVFTPIALFSWLGISATIVIYVAFLSGLYLFTSYCSKRLNKVMSLVVLTSLLMVYFININYTNDKFIKTTTYANYEVEDLSDGEGNYASILRLNRTAASVIERGNHSGYVRYAYDFMVNQLNFVEHDILIMGSGGFTFSMSDETRNRYTYVDIDPAIKDVAEKFFLKFEIKGEFVAKDARQFIRNSGADYDAIFVDLYSNNVSMPWHVTTQSFVRDVSDSLREGGFAMFNLIQEMGFENQDNMRLHNTIQSVFDYCYITPLYFKSDIYANVMYICKKNTDTLPTINIDNRPK